jgi:adenylate cyclase
MSGDLNKLRQFWQELKRRRVIHVITVYASAAFVIIELADNLAEPLNMPPALPTIVIIVLTVGFPLAVILSWIYDLTSEGVEKTKPLDEIEDGEKRTIPNAWKIATYASFVVIIGLVTFNIVRGTKGLRPGDIQSLAILPFNNFTGDDQLDWVAEAMHSVLNSDMGKVSGLRVLSNTTSIAIKKANLTATDMAEKYKIDGVLETDLTCYGDMVCGRIKVIATYPEEKVLWEEEFMEKKSQLPILTNRIIKEVSQKLKVKLTQQEENLLAEAREINPDAYDAYLWGRYLHENPSPQGMHAAVDSFKKAIEIEPEWAAPYAGIVRAVASLRLMVEHIASESDVIMMYENLNKALELDPNSVESHVAKASLAGWTEFDWKTAEAELLKAIEVNPSYVDSQIAYARLLSIHRRTDEAVYHAEKTMELDPQNPHTLVACVQVLLLAEKCQEALYYTNKALSIDPDYGWARDQFRAIYQCLGDYEKAFEAWKRNHVNDWEKFGAAELLETTFHERGWIAFIEELTRLNEGGMVAYIKDVPWLLHYRYLALGEYDRVMDYLEIIYDNNNRDPRLPWIATKPIFDKMKGNPRYLALLEKINLPVSDE